MKILTSQFRFTFCFGPYWCIYAFASQDDFILCTLVYPMNMVLSSIYHEHSSTWSLCEHSPIFYKLSVFSICNSGPSKVHHVSSSDQHPSYLMPTMPIHMVKCSISAGKRTIWQLVSLGYSYSFHVLSLPTSVFYMLVTTINTYPLHSKGI